MPAIMTKTFILKCEWCGIEQELIATFHNKRKRFCSKVCSAKWRMSDKEYIQRVFINNEQRNKKLSIATTQQMSNPAARKNLSEKRIKNNPMHSALIRAKVSETMKKNHTLGGKTPRMGNGHGMTDQESSIFENMPFLHWNFAISLGKRQPNYPTCYKVDLAYVEKKIAIELDGHSHCPLARQEQDHKKEQKLEELGWTVVRFKNEEVTNSLEEVLECLRKLFQAK